MTAPMPRIGDRASWARVTAALESRALTDRVRDDHVDARCPAHDDGRASLTADYQSGDPGRVLLRCHAGCEYTAVVAALGLREADLFDGPSPDRARRPGPRARPAGRPAPARPAAARVKCDRCQWREVEAYRYLDRDEVVLEVVRKRCERCGAKNFPVRSPDGRGGWAWKWPEHRPLYRLDQVREAVGQRGTVYVAEGEKDVHALEAAGLVATCNPGGAGKWRDAHTRALIGAGKVVVVADRDKAGYKHAAAIRASFTLATVEVVEAAEGKDAADHLAAGRAPADLVPIDPDVKLAELEVAEAAARITALDDHRGGRAQPPGGGGDGGQADPDRGRPSGNVPMSRRAGAWGYALEGEEFPGFDGRGVYEMDGSTWRKVAPLPHCHVRIIRRDGTGSQVGTEFVVSAAADGPRKIMGHLVLHDGSWANELGLPLSDDPRVVQATGTAIRELAHSDGVPEREAVPRVGGDGRTSVPVPECLPGGYLRCAPGTRAAGLGGWRQIVAAVAATPKLAAVLGASAFGPYMRALHRQSYWLDLFGEPGQGKTTALTLGAGVWGAALGHDQAVRLSWNNTGIGISRHLGALGILPAFTDESGMAGFTPADWGKLIFQTTEGNQRTTAQQKSIQGTNRTLPWNGVLFVSGNGRVTAGLGAGKYAGLVRRVISVASPFTRSALEAEQLVGGYETPQGEHVPGLLDGCYGHLGAEILDRFGADDARRFLAESAPLVGALPEEAVARTLAKHLHAAVAGAAMADEILGTGVTLREAAAEFAREYLAEHGATPEHDADRIIAAIREAIAREPARWPTKSEYAEHLQPAADSPLGAAAAGRLELPQRGMAREFAGVRADDGSWVAVFPATFHDELAAKHGVDEHLALAELFRRGVLQVAKSRRRDGGWLTPVRLEPKPAAPVAMYKLALPELADEEDEITGQPADTPRTHAPVAEERSPETPQVKEDDSPETRQEAEPGPDLQAPLEAPEADQARQGFVTAGERFTAPAVVADVDGGYLTRSDRLERLELPSPLRDLADAAGWAVTLRLGLAHEAGMPDDPVLALLPELAARLGLPVSAPEKGSKAAKEHPALGSLRASGWNIDQLGSWMRAWKPGGRTVRIWLPAWDEYGTCPMWGDGAPASTLAYRLGLFAERTGIGWRMNGGITGIDLGKTFRRRTLKLEAADPPKIAMAPLETDIVWSRKPLSDEAGLGWLHCYDGNGAYTSAYNTPVNCGGWQHVEAPEFDPKRPGYWLAELPEWSDQLLPDPADPTGRDARTGRRSGAMWRATPTLAILTDLGYQIKPREAWLPSSDAYGRYWEPWYQRVRDARAAFAGSADVDDQAVLDALRSMWHATHGTITIASQGKRRDHDHTIIAAYRGNLVRRLVRIGDAEGRWPLAIATDNVAFASADPDPVAACPERLTLGTGLGQFKHAGTLPMGDAAPMLGTARSADIARLFEAAREWREAHHGAS